MLHDRYDLPLSTASTAARDAYVAGVDNLIAGVAGYREHLERALEADPSFALAHIALARGLFLDAELTAARASAARAGELARGTTAREHSHVEMLALGIAGQPARSRQAMHEHLRDWPRDAMVLAPATSVFGLYGFSGDAAHEEQLYALLASLAPAYGDDWWFESVYGFAACETGRLDQAWTLLEHSLAAQPRNANAAHFRSHVLYERGETSALLAYLEAWLPTLPKRSLTHCHLSWHAALAALDAGRVERAWQVYRTGVHPGGAWGPPLNVVTDSVSFLWRAELAGLARDATLWREVRAHALQCFPKAGVAYADVHTLLACLAAEDHDTLQRLVDEIRQRLVDQRYPAGDVVVRITDGCAAYAAGRWGDAVRVLQAAWPEVVRIGGSRAQRDLVELTLIAALLRDARRDEAMTRISQRGRNAPVGVAALR